MTTLGFFDLISKILYSFLQTSRESPQQNKKLTKIPTPDLMRNFARHLLIEADRRERINASRKGDVTH